MNGIGRAGADNRRVRILHLLPDLRIGGGQQVVLNFLRHVDRDRFELLVAVLHGGGELVDEVRAAGAWAGSLGHRPGHATLTLRRTVSMVRSIHPDLVHVHSELERPFAHFAGLTTGTPVVGHIHAMTCHLQRRPGARVRPPRASALAELEHLAVRQYVATSPEAAVAWRPHVRRPIDVLPQSVDVDLFASLDAPGAAARRRALGIPEGAMVVGCVARLDADKGQADLIDVVANLSSAGRDTHLLLVGDGPRRPELARRVAALGLGGRVHLLGSRRDVPELLPLMDVFAFPSRHEGFGLAIVEAMAAGLPVVAYDLPVFRSFLRDGHTGHAVPVLNQKAFTRAVERLLTDPEAGQAMGRAGRELMRSQYPPQASSRALEQIYVRLLQPGGRRPSGTAMRTTDSSQDSRWQKAGAA